jgi:hypothetical protein
MEKYSWNGLLAQLICNLRQGPEEQTGIISVFQRDVIHELQLGQVGGKEGKEKAEVLERQGKG